MQPFSSVAIVPIGKKKITILNAKQFVIFIKKDLVLLPELSLAYFHLGHISLFSMVLSSI